jgi:uncharacterized membrane protein
MDLIFILILTIISIPVVELTLGVPRIILGVIILLIFPGYSLMSALFPGKKNITGIERAGLTLVLSFAVVSLTGLALNYTPWGIKLQPITISMCVIIFVLICIAYLRRRRLSETERFSLHFSVRLPHWRNVGHFDKVLYIVLAVVVVGSISTLGYVIAKPKPQEAFTNFYMLGPAGKMENYPNSLRISQSASITLGIENKENQAASYTVSVVFDGQTVQTLGPFTLANKEKWSGDITLTPSRIGDNQKVEFLLFKQGISEPYLTLRLWLDVTQ